MTVVATWEQCVGRLPPLLQLQMKYKTNRTKAAKTLVLRYLYSFDQLAVLTLAPICKFHGVTNMRYGDNS